MLVGEASSEIVRVSASFGGSFWVTALAHYTRLLYLSKQSFELCSLKLLKKIYSINFKDDNERDRIIEYRCLFVQWILTYLFESEI